MYASGNLLLRTFYKCLINVKCYLFKTYCSNLYCTPIWFDCTKTTLKKLKVALTTIVLYDLWAYHSTTVLVKCLLI